MSKGRCREKKEFKENTLKNIMIIWKPLVGKYLQWVKEPTNEVDNNTVAVVLTDSHCKQEVVGLLQ